MLLDMLKNTSSYLMLKKDKDNNSLSHAYLVISEDGLARKSFLTLAALSIICKHACMECGACSRILKGIHVDVKTYDGAKMSVKDINVLVDDTQTRSIEGGKKIYLIDNAEGLSAAAQNKMLKTYEEPGEDIIIILAANNQSSILTTIRSRAKILHIPPFAATDITKMLIESGCERDDAEVAAAYAQGSLERAERMSGEENYRQAFADALDVLLTLRNSKQLTDYIFLPIFSKENIALTLDFLEIILADILILTSGANVELKTAHRDYDLQQIKKGFTAAGAAMALLAVNEGRKMLYFNINPTSVAERILFDILEAKYKWR
jgi:DNA polymerase-3 subunit delta'